MHFIATALTCFLFIAGVWSWANVAEKTSTDGNEVKPTETPSATNKPDEAATDGNAGKSPEMPSATHGQDETANDGNGGKSPEMPGATNGPDGASTNANDEKLTEQMPGATNEPGRSDIPTHEEFAETQRAFNEQCASQCKKELKQTDDVCPRGQQIWAALRNTEYACSGATEAPSTACAAGSSNDTTSCPQPNDPNVCDDLCEQKVDLIQKQLPGTKTLLAKCRQRFGSLICECKLCRGGPGAGKPNDTSKDTGSPNTDTASNLMSVADFRTLHFNTTNDLETLNWTAVLGTDSLYIEADAPVYYDEDKDFREITVNCKGNIQKAEIPVQAIELMCVNGKCMRLMCDMNPTNGSNKQYSRMPANNRVLFNDSYNCQIKTPDCWEDWSNEYFGGPVELTDDIDDDGLVNVLEYYGDAFMRSSFIRYVNGTKTEAVPAELPTCEEGSPVASNRSKRTKRSLKSWNGTDPKKPDTDGDLLLDGFEAANGMNATDPDDLEGDKDNDGIDNLNEQILRTDPTNPDTDGDGTGDKPEVDGFRDPADPIDKNAVPPPPEDINGEIARVMLSVGDPSGSHSERYILHVGPVSHQSPGYGLVGSGTYNFKPGKYPVRMQHYGSNLAEPDFDYLGQVYSVGGAALFNLEDPDGFLGYHGGSDVLFAAGKVATLTITADCSPESGKNCSISKKCTICPGGPEANAFRQQLSDNEGYQNAITNDTNGKLTVGIGHKVSLRDPEYGQKPGTPVSDARIRALFDQDVTKCIKDSKRLFPNFDELPDFAQKVIADMTFSLGYDGMAKLGKFKDAINAKDYNKAADEIEKSDWYNQNGERGKKLVNMMRNQGATPTAAP